MLCRAGAARDANAGREEVAGAAALSAWPIHQKSSGGFEERLQDAARFLGQRCFFKRASHQLQPAIAGGLSDCEWRVADAEPGMAALFDVGLRAAEAENQEIAQSMPRGFEIVRGVHGPEDIVAGNLAVKRVRKTLESVVTDGCIDMLLFH
jgi:hypothetical protein